MDVRNLSSEEMVYEPVGSNRISDIDDLCSRWQCGCKNNIVRNVSDTIKFYKEIVNKNPCGPFETDFFCVAARKKYMTEEQKRTVRLGDTCMLNKVILKRFDIPKFLSKLNQADACVPYYLDRGNNQIPSSCFVFYMNLNHTDVFKAMHEFRHLLADWDYDLNTLLEFSNDNKRDNLGNQIKSIKDNLMKSFQNPKNMNKRWFDIDCDFVITQDSERVLDAIMHIKKVLCDVTESEVYAIVTQGGVHYVVLSDALSEYNTRLALKIQNRCEIKDKVLTPASLKKLIIRECLNKHIEIKEIDINQNSMVPMPGTMQNGHLVYLA